MNRESLAQAIHFFDLDTDSDDNSDEQDNSSFGEEYYDEEEETRDDDTATPTTRIRQFPHVHIL
jgi:hypothetical protein